MSDAILSFGLYGFALASKMASRSLLTASSASSSPTTLKDARTYAVFLPFGRKTVPGSAMTPLSNAFVRITLSESPSSCSDTPRRNLNLQTNENLTSNPSTAKRTRRTTLPRGNPNQLNPRDAPSKLAQIYPFSSDRKKKHGQCGP